MEAPPEILDRAHVIQFVRLTQAHRPTAKTRHTVNGRPLPRVSGLVIARYEGEEACYLFYCDAAWNVMTDTWHPDVPGAVAQAEFEFEGTSHSWEQR